MAKIQHTFSKDLGYTLHSRGFESGNWVKGHDSQLCQKSDNETQNVLKYKNQVASRQKLRLRPVNTMIYLSPPMLFVA